MHSVMVSYLFPLSILALVSAIFLPPLTPWNITDSTLSITPSNLTSVPLPPEFDILYVWSESEPLNPLAVYRTAIHAVYATSTKGWNSEEASDWDIASQIGEWKIFIVLTGCSRVTELQASHVILTIREAIFRMARRQPGFFMLSAYPQLRHQRIGEVKIRNEPHRPSLINNVTGKTGVQEPIFNASLTADSGEFADPSDDRLIIRWNYESAGLDIPAQAVFTAILDTQVVAASQSQGKICDHVTGYGAFDNTVLAITRTPGLDWLTYEHVSRLLFHIANGIIFKERRFGEMGFSFLWIGQEIGIGALFRPKRPGQDVDTSVLAVT